jgi:hypothetical protein
MDLPISFEIYQQLLRASAGTGFEKEIWEIGAAAIRDWVVRNDPDSIAMPATAGYQWKSLFLPNGTLLRTVFNGKNFHCLVEEDHILYDGKPVSPSGFANAVGGVRRNAWKVIWILFPNSSVWKLAGTLRAKKTPLPSRSQRTNSVGEQQAGAQPTRRDVPQPHGGRAERRSAPRHQADGDKQGSGGSQRLLCDVSERDCAAGPTPHRSGQNAGQRRGDDQRGSRREQRTGQDRRRVQPPVPQQRAPEPERARHPRGADHHEHGRGEHCRHMQAGVEDFEAEADPENQRQQVVWRRVQCDTRGRTAAGYWPPSVAPLPTAETATRMPGTSKKPDSGPP